MLETLNDFSGLFALLALIASVAIPFIIYLLQRKNERDAEQKRFKEEQLTIQNELDSFRSDGSPFPMSEIERLKRSRIRFLEKQSQRKR